MCAVASNFPREAVWKGFLNRHNKRQNYSMLFNSVTFLLFYLAVFAGYYLLPQKSRWLLLLVSSYGFYMAWNPYYIILILISTIIDYTVALRLEETEDAVKRKRLLQVSLTANLGLLFFFKYFNFFSKSTFGLLSYLGFTLKAPVVDVLLPVGISFYTFQTLSYTIDVYRRELKAERHFGRFALFVTFFPQLVAGPIERASNLLPQLQKFDVPLTYQRFASGLTQSVYGLFKKVVVADNLAVYVDAVYNHPASHNSATALLATYFFAFQIYCDFSGYSDIAIGTAKMLGFDFNDNFQTPYFSSSVTEFWRRWHISLSSWLRDYLYIPLGGNRHGEFNTYRNLMLTMLLGGLWHGASWSFVLWGALNGFYLSMEKLVNYHQWVTRSTLHRIFGAFITFHCICLTWVYFRADSFAKANTVVGKLFHFQGVVPEVQDLNVFLTSLLAVFILLVLDFFVFRKTSFDQFSKALKDWQLALFMAILFLLTVLFGVADGSVFIYFQF